MPALLADVWDSASSSDRAVVARLAQGSEYTAYESELRSYLRSEDGRLEREGTLWAVQAPVDVFVHLSPLLGNEHLEQLSAVAQDVFGELDPALDLEVKDRPFCATAGAERQHSSLLRDGLANTLLAIALPERKDTADHHTQVERRKFEGAKKGQQHPLSGKSAAVPLRAKSSYRKQRAKIELLKAEGFHVGIHA